jgi:integrase
MPKPSRKQLTEEAVAKMKPPESGQLDHFDSLVPGLILRVGYGGSKTWLVRHYLKRRNKNGKRISVPTTQKLGRYPILKVKEARERARLFLADPVKARTQAASGSFAEITANFIKRRVEKEALRSRYEIERLLNKHILPHWAERPLHELKRSDVVELLDKIEDGHGARQADYALSIIGSIMRWHAGRSDDYVPPVVPAMRRYKTADHSRKRILADDEIRALWQAADQAGSFGALLKVLLLTGQRRAKVLGMKWSDVVDDAWIIPSEAREKPNAGTLKLPATVLAIINAQPRIAGHPYVFGGHNGPYTAMSKRKPKLDAKLGFSDWVFHDLRRTARSLMSRAGVRPDIAERTLGHKIKGVEGVYDQHPYADEKAAALAALAALVERIVTPPAGNVVELAAARAP